MSVERFRIRYVIVYSDDESSLPSFSEQLPYGRCEVIPVRSEAQLLSSIDRYSPECAVVYPCRSFDAEAVRIAAQVRSIDRACPLLVLTSSISADTAICAMRAGITDIVSRSAPERDIIARLTSLTGEQATTTGSRARDEGLIGGHLLVGSSAAIRHIRGEIAKVAAVDVSVLITGETGTGKELVAQLIHRNSRASHRPFVALNCAAVPDALLESELFGCERGAYTGATNSREGKLQHAAGGVLFLDEIGDMSLAAQAKILRAIESRVVQRLGSNVDIPVQVRLVAATNQNLEELTREKKFRDDLYFRLNVVRIELPPLRSRLGDIPELAEHMIEEISRRHRLSSRRLDGDLIRRFQRYHWPGNVREMRNVLESILVLSPARSVGVADLPSHILQMLRSSDEGFADERSKILSVLKSTDWNRNEAARILCCSRMTLYRKMVKHSISADGHSGNVTSRNTPPLQSMAASNRRH